MLFGKETKNHSSILTSMDVGKAPAMHPKGSEKLEISHGLGRERKMKGKHPILDLDD